MHKRFTQETKIIISPTAQTQSTDPLCYTWLASARLSKQPQQMI